MLQTVQHSAQFEVGQVSWRHGFQLAPSTSQRWLKDCGRKAGISSIENQESYHVTMAELRVLELFSLGMQLNGWTLNQDDWWAKQRMAISDS